MAYRIRAVVEDYDEGQVRSLAPRAMRRIPLKAIIKMIPEKEAIREMNEALDNARIDARVRSFSVDMPDGRIECAIGYEGEPFFRHENEIRGLLDSCMEQYGLSCKITFHPYQAAACGMAQGSNTEGR